MLLYHNASYVTRFKLKLIYLIKTNECRRLFLFHVISLLKLRLLLQTAQLNVHAHYGKQSRALPNSYLFFTC